MNSNQRVVRYAALAAVCVLLVGTVSTVFGKDHELAYRRQFQALDASDVKGHMTLAKWCREKEAWELLKKQCEYVLTLDPNHATAKIYLKLAETKLGVSTAAPAGSSQGSSGGSAKRSSQPIRELTDEEVQILRRSELLLDRPERVPVKFRNDVLERFWDYMVIRENLTKKDKAAFNRLRPAVVKAQRILARIADYKRSSTEDFPFDDQYSSDIEIERDPAMFRAFVSPRVSGVIITSCATNRCHGGTDAGEFMLFNERNMTDGMNYANYLMLHEYEKDGERLINRDTPKRSLLLIFGQPDTTGPGTDHPTKVDVVFPNPRHVKYRNLLQWLTGLPAPTPDYGFSLAEPAETGGKSTN
ncbi:MAG: hypothetical protein GXP29_09000 [Planctomycetes bacterium]|nr:hypothetical protein [Planctomycetota bacterium]